MSDSDKYTVQDLISNAADQQPIEFENAFNSLVVDRIRSAVENRKQEIATSMFNSAEVREPEEE